MAAQYQVNVNIMAGVDFVQEYHLTNPDLSPMDITGCKFGAIMRKHPESVDATKTTATERVVPQLAFDTKVVSGIGGVFSISVPGARTKNLREGKYVYNVSMKDRNGQITSSVGGLVFVDRAFGATIFDGGSTAPMEGEITLDGGGAS